MRAWQGRDGGAVPVPLRGRQPGCLHQDLLAAPHPIRALKPNQVSVTTACSAQRATGARKAQEQVPKCHVCSGGASPGGGGYAELREARGGGVGAAQGAEPRESLLASSCGCFGGFTHTCCVALAESRTPIASPPCFEDLESLLRNCSKESLGPARAEGRCVHVQSF